jgi:hypothetical protein
VGHAWPRRAGGWRRWTPRGVLGSLTQDQRDEKGAHPMRRTAPLEPRPRLPRRALHAVAPVPDTAGRRGRLPVRGSHRAADHRRGQPGLHRPQPAEGVAARGNGPMPGPHVRPHRDRTDRARARNLAAGGRDTIGCVSRSSR